MRPSYLLKPCLAADFDFVYQLRREAFAVLVRESFGDFDEAADEERFRDRFDPSRHQRIVVDGEPVGILEIESAGDAIRIRTLALRKDARNQGIGSRVVEDLKRANQPLILRVLKRNTAARRFYERLGFSVVGESEQYWWSMSFRPA